MTTKGSNNPFPSVLMNEVATDGSDTPTPAADYRRLFLGEDGYLHTIDSSDVVQDAVDVTGAAGNVATDAIWDAAGDLAVGSGANTAARLAKGAAGANLSTYNGVVAWNGGTSFPASPASGDRYWRSDLGMECYFDGTRWLSVQVFTRVLSPYITTPSGNYRDSISTSQVTGRTGAPSILGGSDIYLLQHKTVFIVNSGGTALGASHKWVGTVDGMNTSGSSTGTVATTNVDSGSSGVWRAQTNTINAVQASGVFFYQATWNKTGTPGTLIVGDELTYRVIAT